MGTITVWTLIRPILIFSSETSISIVVCQVVISPVHINGLISFLFTSVVLVPPSIMCRADLHSASSSPSILMVCLLGAFYFKECCTPGGGSAAPFLHVLALINIFSHYSIRAVSSLGTVN